MCAPTFYRYFYFYLLHKYNIIFFFIYFVDSISQYFPPSIVAPGGDHVISLIDEISYMSPPAPLLSQYDDVNPEQFCNGDNRPANCGQNCMCTHKVDIPLNAVVEIVLVDEGMINSQLC